MLIDPSSRGGCKGDMCPRSRSSRLNGVGREFFMTEGGGRESSYAQIFKEEGFFLFLFSMLGNLQLQLFTRSWVVWSKPCRAQSICISNFILIWNRTNFRVWRGFSLYFSHPSIFSHQVHRVRSLELWMGRGLEQSIGAIWSNWSNPAAVELATQTSGKHLCHVNGRYLRPPTPHFLGNPFWKPEKRARGRCQSNRRLR